MRFRASIVEKYLSSKKYVIKRLLGAEPAVDGGKLPFNKFDVLTSGGAVALGIYLGYPFALTPLAVPSTLLIAFGLLNIGHNGNCLIEERKRRKRTS